MKNTGRAILLVLSAAILLFGGYEFKKRYYDPKENLRRAGAEAKNLDAKLSDGDIIFQTSKSGQSNAIQLATHSKYSHCGILFKDSGQWEVYEGAGPVKKTPLNLWIAHGMGRNYAIKRLDNANARLGPKTIDKMKNIANGFMGKEYDTYFGWDDEKIYCSELVWKIYRRGAGISIGQLQQLKDFDLDNPLVKKQIQHRYGNKAPMNDTVISPASIYNNPNLKMVASNYAASSTSSP